MTILNSFLSTFHMLFKLKITKLNKISILHAMVPTSCLKDDIVIVKNVILIPDLMKTYILYR